MSNFCEIIDGCRTAPRRGIEWNASTKELTINAGKKATTYAVTRFAADGGNGYRLAKLHSTDTYNVFCRSVGGEFYSSCDCAGFTFCRTGPRPTCRHLLAMEALEMNADLIRTEEPAPVAMTADEALDELTRLMGMNPAGFKSIPSTIRRPANTARDLALNAAYRM